MPNNNISDKYENRLFNKNKNFIPTDDFPWFCVEQYMSGSQNVKILDADCGSGKYCERLSGLGFKNFYGIDLLDDGLFKNINFKYNKSSIDKTPFEDNFFDIVFANSVIYHLEDTDKAIKELSRILKNNGISI